VYHDGRNRSRQTRVSQCLLAWMFRGSLNRTCHYGTCALWRNVGRIEGAATRRASQPCGLIPATRDERKSARFPTPRLELQPKRRLLFTSKTISPRYCSPAFFALICIAFAVQLSRQLPVSVEECHIKRSELVGDSGEYYTTMSTHPPSNYHNT